jgi:hypothetical protein
MSLLLWVRAVITVVDAGDPDPPDAAHPAGESNRTANLHGKLRHNLVSLLAISLGRI